MKLIGNTKAARPSISSTSSTKKSHRASPRYVFCRTRIATLSTLGSALGWRSVQHIPESYDGDAIMPSCAELLQYKQAWDNPLVLTDA